MSLFIYNPVYETKLVSAANPPYKFATHQSTFPYEICWLIAFPYLPPIKPPVTATVSTIYEMFCLFESEPFLINL